MSRNVKLYIFLIVTSYLAGFYLVARIPELTIFPGIHGGQLEWKFSKTNFTNSGFLIDRVSR